MIFFVESGKVYSFGANSEGQLGLGSADAENRTTPQLIDGLPEEQYKVLTGGTDHAAALTGGHFLFIIKL